MDSILWTIFTATMWFIFLVTASIYITSFFSYMRHGRTYKDEIADKYRKKFTNDRICKTKKDKKDLLNWSKKIL